jgi:diguanylate cyclase (GGDEF)-like protein
MTCDNEIVSSAGPTGVRFNSARTRLTGLQRSDDDDYVARCVDYEATLKVCTFASASLVTTTRDQMFQIGAAHTRALMWQFLASAALALGALVVALLAAVRHLTKGLSKLAKTAQDIAGGDLDVPFRATGIGEVRSLGLAFERMLTHLRTSTRRIHKLAFYDTVSRIPNREKMRADAPALIGAEEGGALFFLHLDGFKSVNDTFGHKLATNSSRMVAERLGNLLMARGIGRKYLLARVGGDEFVAIIAGVNTVREASLRAREMIEALRGSFKLQSNQATIGASIGIAIYPTQGSTYDDLLIRADLAMYAAKSSGRNTYAFFTPDLAETRVPAMRSKPILPRRSAMRNSSSITSPRCPVWMAASGGWRRWRAGITRRRATFPLSALSRSRRRPASSWRSTALCSGVRWPQSGA